MLDDEDRARADFILLWFADRDRGSPRTPQEYLLLFPGYENVIERELLRLAIPPADAATPETAGAAPSSRAWMLDHYRIDREIGRGAQGAVFLAWDTRVGRRVALKVLNASSSGSEAMVERFEREARALARLDHPGIAAVHDVGSVDGLEYFAMRHVEGRTLAAELRDHPSDSVHPDAAIARCVAIIEKCARALHVAHEAGLVHRDVKPGNIMVTPEGEPVVLDFGVARFLDSEAARLTVTGDILGTPAFMAPEQIAGDLARIDRRTDVYGLAMVLRALTANASPKDRSVSRNLEAVLEVASDPDPDRRYATAAAFAEDLARVRSGQAVLVRPPGPVRKLASWARRAPAVAALVFLPPVVLLGGLVALSVKNEEIRAAAHELETREAEAQSAAKEATDRFTDFRRLEDLRLVQDLEERARELWPPYPTIAAGLERWLADADDLLGRLPSHRSALMALRRSGRSVATREIGQDAAIDRLLRCERVRDAARAEISALPGSDSRRSSLEQILAQATQGIEQLERVAASRPSWRFDRVEDKWLHENLTLLVQRLESLDGGSKHGCTRTSVRHRLAVALELERRTRVEPAATWRDAVAAIANPETDPAYGGLRIEPILGLVPLGRDPKSHLWEFAHVLSGEVPARNGAGDLVIGERSAIVLVLIPGGRIRMGARVPVDDDEPSRDHVDPAAAPHEQPVHEVTLDPFFISKYEMTQGQWLRVMGSNPSHHRSDRNFDDGERPTLRFPVEQVSFEDCVDALERYGLEVPTEAQWECAARAGTTTPWWPGEAIESFLTFENLADSTFGERPHPGYSYDSERADGWSGPAPVGAYPGNPFGIQDTIGNVTEWCRDRIEVYRTPALPGDGLRAGGLAEARAIRGGAWNMIARSARSSGRSGVDETTRTGWLGVRPSLRVARP